jgi:hypothetical protein
MEQDLREWVLWQDGVEDSVILPELLMVLHPYRNPDIGDMAMDRALVAVLFKDVALDAVLGLVLAGAGATEEVSTRVALTLPWKNGMGVSMPWIPVTSLICSKMRPVPWKKNLMP